MPPLSPAQIACLVIVVVAAVIDLRTAKIPNLLTFPAAALGIILQLVQFGPQGALWAVEGWFLGVGIMLATRIFGFPFGMGDVKLIAAIGSLLGPSMIFLVFFWFFLSFAPIAWIRLASAVPWKQLIVAFPQILFSRNLQVLKQLDWSRFNDARKSKLMFGPFYAVGTFCALFLEQPTRKFLGM